ncbi:hypothetical protein CJ235_02880 [Staphylococcus pettenkoferi]|uniref:Uncharacterized protein n=1 Tax=Staphylococcus pettenkoferi TaxID=170573 RepID=A0A2N6QLS3_9STAP|nr:hypothetical protein HMPREF2802_06885 [Staphylococcus sp. HMSC071G07]PMC20637.1 hypothetical protein CJ235_02880 [Staphylococcus pettenkoferi]
MYGLASKTRLPRGRPQLIFAFVASENGFSVSSWIPQASRLRLDAIGIVPGAILCLNVVIAKNLSS